jgi:DNA mismatch endonuclease, patch repair protein
MDVFTKKKRSEVMAAVRSKGNRSTELVLAGALRRHGVTGWRRHPRVAVFVDGCFWHCCPVHGTKPATHTEFWLPKLKKNRRRDRRVSAALRRQGWTVVRLWEHSVRRDVDRCVARIRKSVSP